MPPTPDKSPAPRPTGPGRPKDLGKRAAILAAARQMFTTQGYEGTSMDQIAAEAGVSKLTVYSHFQDKDTLFVEAVKAKCEDLLPSDLFVARFEGPVRDHLLRIARAFFRLITSEEAISIHRIMSSTFVSPIACRQRSMMMCSGPVPSPSKRTCVM